jgi:pimeloyl-ACP methyl ester carboxylesterase
MARMPRTIRILLAALAAAVALAAVGVAATWAPDLPVEALGARWAPPPSTFAEVKGLRVHLRDEGPRDDREPVVLLHGTSASLHTWEGWVAALRTQRRVITFDLPGFGLTGPNAAEDYREATYVRFVLDLLDTLGVQRFVVGGNSLGGDIAWRTAAAVPERVAALILVDAAGFPFTPAAVPIGFRAAGIPVVNRLLEFTLPRSVVAASVRSVYGDPARVSEALIDRYEALARRTGNRRAVVRRFAQMDRGAAQAQIATLKLPTLILWGGRDRLIPPEIGHRFARDIAGSTLVVFDDLGHVPQEEDPARTLVPVRRFLGLAT